MKKEVLDKGWIELVNVSCKEEDIANIARTSFNNYSSDYEKNKKLITRLYKDRHTSPFEHPHLTFNIYAPMVVWWQWVRHRTQNYNLQSGRYSVLTDEFYIPEVFYKQHPTNKQMSSELVVEETEELKQLFQNHMESSYNLYEKFLSYGVSKETARLLLPPTIYYKGIVTVDLHNLIGFLRLRTAPDAQYEIREYAQKIIELVEPHFPITIGLFKENER